MMTGEQGAPSRTPGRRVFAFLLLALGFAGIVCAVAWGLQVPGPAAEPGTSPLPAALLVALVSAIFLAIGFRFYVANRRSDGQR